ncbi:MAG: TonB-dependent receptor [Bacteroidales bacterium]|nr:TonB-dependent receptor [Bacteroidales bacterium]
MKIKIILFISLLSAMISPLYSQSKKLKTDINITGHVKDKTTGEHIPYATIVLLSVTDENGVKQNSGSQSFGAVSDESGHYMITNLPEGTLTFKASFIGYEPMTASIKTSMGNTSILHFQLDPSQTDLEEVVVTGNRYATKKRETASIVSVVSPKMFENTMAKCPADILDFQPGLRVEYDCGNCGVPQLRINGLSGQYTQMLLDSRPIFSSLGMVYGLEQLPAAMIERVEVVRGGGSALFGSNAIGGTVNIITKEPTSSLIQLSNQSVFLGKGSSDINTSLNGSIVSDDYKTGVYLFSMMRDRSVYDRNDDGYSELPQINNKTMGFRAYRKIGQSSKLTAEFHAIDEFRRGGDNLENPPHEASLAEQIEHSIYGGGINYDYLSKNLRNSFNIYSSAQNIDRKSYFGTNMNLDAYGKTDDITFNAGAQWIHRFENLWFMPASFTAGTDYTYNSLTDKMLGYNRTIDQKTNLVGVYAQNEWSTKKASVLIGGRLDKHSMIDNPIFSPRATLRFALNDNITLRSGYAMGYRAPQVYDEDLHVGAVGGEVSLIEVSDNLKPENSNSLNLSLDYWKQMGHWQANFLIEGFYTDLSDVFVLVENGRDSQNNLLYLRENGKGAKVYGLNFETRIAHGDKINIQGGYTLQRSRYKYDFKWSENVNAQRKMFNSPDNYGYFTFDFKPVSPLTLSLNSVITGKMIMQHAAGAIEADKDETTSGFCDISFRAAYDFKLSGKVNFTLSAAIRNIFDQYQPDLDYGMNKDSKYFYGPQLPRCFSIGGKLSF